MQHTLVAVFDDRSNAQNAMNALISSGFARAEISLPDADPTGMTDSSGRSLAPAHGAPIKHIFTELFGADNSIRASRYEGAVTRGHHVLVLRADSLPDVERAADIVERFGPSDIDEQASRDGAVGTDTGGPIESVRMSGAGNLQQASPASAQPRAGSRLGTNQHLDKPGDRMVSRQHSLNRSEPASGTCREAPRESGPGATGGTSLHGSTLRKNAAHVPSIEDIETGPGGSSGSMQRDTSLGGAPLESPRVTETRLGRSRIYSAEPSPLAGGSSGLDIGSKVFDDDDDHYRKHFLSSYSGEEYERVKPAYSYGAEMRKSELYRNSPWDDVEGHLARGWHAREGAGSGRPMEGAWDRVKAAVRHGWERITADDEGRACRSHWAATYGSAKDAGSYDEYKPAYAFGSAMAREVPYRGRQWNEVENQLRTEWDARQGGGGQSGWDKVKSAVRHGWDRMNS